MNEEIKDKIQEIFQRKLSGEEVDELVAFFRRSFIESISLDDEDPFFKSLVYEMKGEVKELAFLLSDFRTELKSKLHPDLTEIATKYIPQASDQLEGIIETTEMAANKIMDNLEQMQADVDETAGTIESLKQGRVPKAGIEGGNGRKRLDDRSLAMLAPIFDRLESGQRNMQLLISDSFVQMSFQDLTGQRIKKIIALVGDMEERITRMVISFGIKLTAKEKHPEISQADLQKAVDEKVQLLAGPQRNGQGMDQAEIDSLLADL